MPSNLTYPGVYIEELPSGVRTIAGVATSITAFIGRAARGPVNKPTVVDSFADYERLFGGLSKSSKTSYAVRDFFLNGGRQALIVRLFHDNGSPAVVDVAIGAVALKAASPGKWGTGLRLTIDQNVSADVALQMGVPKADLFNLKVADAAPGGLSEEFRNVTLAKTSARRLDKVLADESRLVVWAGANLETAASTPALPALGPDGTISDDVSEKEKALKVVQATLPFNQANVTAAENALKTGAAAMAAKGSDGAVLEAEECARVDPPPAAIILRGRCELSAFELHTLLLCAAMELDTSIASLCAHAHKDPSKAYPTFALALALFPDATWDALSPERPLRSWRVIEIAQPVGIPLTVSPLRADERIVNYLKGLNHLDDRLAMFLTRLASPGQPRSWALAPSQQAVADTLAATLSIRAAPDLVHLLGPDSASKQGIACELAARFELSLYMLPAAVLPSSPAELEGLARIWRREVRLLPVALYVDAREADRDVAAVTRFLARSAGLVFLDTREPWRSLPREPLTVDVARPTRTEQREIWRAQLGDDDVASVLASQFHLSVPEIHRAASTASRETGAPPETLEDRVWEACRTAARPKLDLLAQRLEPKATWDDLVLPAAETRALREIAAHARRRVQAGF